jgi:hypothetical protein
MTDRLRFDTPLGTIGRLVERLVLRSYIRRLIDQRGSYLKARAEQRSR